MKDVVVLRYVLGACALISLIAASPRSDAAIVFGQVDTFEDGTTMNWQEGASSPNPPTNVPTGGPAGNGDHYLQNISTGGFGAGAKMVMFNLAQWTGDYHQAGVNRITLQMANFGATELYMRVAFQSGGGTLYASSLPTVLPADGVWRARNFDLTNSTMTNVGGGETLAQALSHVTEIRILSAIGGPAFNGDPVQGTLGIDNMTATSIPVAGLTITNFTITSGVPRVSFTTASGQSYRVERKNAFTDSNWVAVTNGDNIAGTGGVIQVSDPDPGVASLPHRFYRVVQL
ncbi:MAG: hypothetical protein ACJ8HQ_05795 [Chthoniobacterales bacterium]